MKGEKGKVSSLIKTYPSAVETSCKFGIHVSFIMQLVESNFQLTTGLFKGKLCVH